jgi:hypothetical protein
MKTKDKVYMYNFTSGGWNTEMGTSKRQALAKAKKRWAGTKWSDIDEKSFRIITERELSILLID